MASEVVVLANQKRAEVGCGPVSDDSAFAAVAHAHAVDMSERNYFDHTTPEGVTPWDRAGAAGLDARGENIAAVSPTSAGVIEAWMGSPGHRDNMLNCEHTKLGVGVYLTGPHSPYWVQLFGQ
ncbi:CAP domain-containing protein [Salinibacterium sp.]|nr:CAP domain-containing protein [Salinibacterium sp.]